MTERTPGTRGALFSVEMDVIRTGWPDLAGMRE
jgi:hypothetical protein